MEVLPFKNMSKFRCPAPEYATQKANEKLTKLSPPTRVWPARLDELISKDCVGFCMWYVVAI